VDLFAGIPVRDYEEALAWYKRLLGSEPSFVPHATEAVWELTEHRFLFIVERPEHAGHAMHTIFVGDLDAMVAEIAARGIQPAQRETYSNGVRKATIETPTATRSASGVLRLRRGRSGPCAPTDHAPLDPEPANARSLPLDQLEPIRIWKADNC
jgi:catechol 2,3-dioxygenase-like lactoylglutathione lyase family enzyme